MAKYVWDMVFLLGLVALAAGFYLVYPPLALLALGVTLMALAILASWRKGRSDDDSE